MSHIVESLCPVCNTQTQHSYSYIGVQEIFDKPCVIVKATCIDCVRIKLNMKQPLTPLRRFKQLPIAEWYRIITHRK